MTETLYLILWKTKLGVLMFTTTNRTLHTRNQYRSVSTTMQMQCLLFEYKEPYIWKHKHRVFIIFSPAKDPQYLFIKPDNNYQTYHFWNPIQQKIIFRLLQHRQWFPFLQIILRNDLYIYVNRPLHLYFNVSLISAR